MSKINLTPNASGTGVFTIASPNSNTDRTLTLPDEAGTILSSTSDIESQVKTATNATGSAPIYSCRAWVNFNGTGTVAIIESGNVSSITDNGTGDYTINFTTALPIANHVTNVSTVQGASASSNYIVTCFVQLTAESSVSLLCRPDASSDTKTDVEKIYVSVFC